MRSWMKEIDFIIHQNKYFILVFVKLFYTFIFLFLYRTNVMINSKKYIKNVLNNIFGSKREEDLKENKVLIIIELNERSFFNES